MGNPKVSVGDKVFWRDNDMLPNVIGCSKVVSIDNNESIWVSDLAMTERFLCNGHRFNDVWQLIDTDDGIVPAEFMPAVGQEVQWKDNYIGPYSGRSGKSAVSVVDSISGFYVPARDWGHELFINATSDQWQFELPMTGVQVEEDKCAEAEMPTDDYHACKFDKGKADYTLLPTHALGQLLWHAIDSEPMEQSEDDGGWQDSSAQGLAEYMARGQLKNLLDAYLSAVKTSVVETLPGVVAILEYGAKKYARDSWRGVPDAHNRYYSAAMRHLTALASGKQYDVPEGADDVPSAPSADGQFSGMPHLSHYHCNLLFLIGLHVGE